MAKFKFKLQTFLNVKEQIEKSIKIELGIAVQKFERQKTILKEIQHEIENQEKDYREEAISGVTLSSLRNRIEYIHVMRENEISQKQRVNEEKINVDKIRERLIEIMKEKKVLEKLKEKELALFKKEQEKAAQLLVDELVTYNEAKKPTGDGI
ncbi:MAG: flagellar export protein FliJ [Ruminiclostridium sp.]|nr:flagellar export protein FliJ [Ruminiclostridium sp.]